MARHFHPLFACVLGLALWSVPAMAATQCPASGQLPAAAEGAVGYDGGTHALYFCDGTIWTAIATN